MALRLYDTLAKKDVDFVPLDPAGKRVTMYTCGPTVYGRIHVGNFSAFLMADLLRRWLETGHGYNVIHVKNITDVGHLVADRDSGEDKIEKQAREEFGSITHETVLKVARSYESLYRNDEALLNFLEPFQRPRASEYVEHMKTMIESLLEKGHAYATSDGIYFDVTSKTRTPYGSLSGNTLDNLASGARVHVNEEKKHPADFALWKFCVGQNEHHALRWSSPTGPVGVIPSGVEGFPGWHIECSAMSRAIVGDTIDLHTGGEDNIFPHHECEIAQSESVTGKPFVKTWLHRRRIDLEGEKMSKSLGNVVTISNILEHGYEPADLRFYLLSVHYRTNLKFTWKGMDDARKARTKIIEWMKELKRVHREDAVSGVTSREPIVAMARFSQAMDADLNTPAALAEIFTLMNHYYAHAPYDRETHMAFIDFVEKARYTFGCFEYEDDVVAPVDVQQLLDARSAARTAKDFAESDRLRGEIEKRGFAVKDTGGGQALRKI